MTNLPFASLLLLLSTSPSAFRFKALGGVTVGVFFASTFAFKAATFCLTEKLQ